MATATVFLSPIPQTAWAETVQQSLVSFWTLAYLQAGWIRAGTWLLIKWPLSWPVKISWFLLKRSWVFLIVMCFISYDFFSRLRWLCNYPVIRNMAVCRPCHTPLGPYLCSPWELTPCNTTVGKYIYNFKPAALDIPQHISIHDESIRDSSQALAQIVSDYVRMNYMAKPLRHTMMLTYDVQALITHHQFPSKAKLDKELGMFRDDTEINIEAFENLSSSLARLVKQLQSTTSELEEQLGGLERWRQREYVTVDRSILYVIANLFFLNRD